MSTNKLGSIITGTIRTQDLVPALVDWLKEAECDSKEFKEVEETWDAYEPSLNHGYFESEEASFDLEALFSIMNRYAPPMCYFGANPGDGANFGFWVIQNLEDQPEVFVAPNDLLEPEIQGPILGEMALHQIRIEKIVWDNGWYLKKTYVPKKYTVVEHLKCCDHVLLLSEDEEYVALFTRSEKDPTVFLESWRTE